jgi:hypothetical protein
MGKTSKRDAAEWRELRRLKGEQNKLPREGEEKKR